MLVKQPVKPGNGSKRANFKNRLLFEGPPFSVLVAIDGAALTHLGEVLEADRRPPVQRDERVAGLLPDVRLVTSDARL